MTLLLTDVNECEANLCSQECANVYGSYQCYCRRGYELSDVDGVTCEGTHASRRSGSFSTSSHPGMNRVQLISKSYSLLALIAL